MSTVSKINNAVARIDLCVRDHRKFGDVVAGPGEQATVVGDRACGMIGMSPNPGAYFWLALYGEGQSKPHTFLWSDGHKWTEGKSVEECVELSGSDDVPAQEADEDPKPKPKRTTTKKAADAKAK